MVNWPEIVSRRPRASQVTGWVPTSEEAGGMRDPQIARRARRGPVEVRTRRPRCARRPSGWRSAGTVGWSRATTRAALLDGTGVGRGRPAGTAVVAPEPSAPRCRRPSNRRPPSVRRSVRCSCVARQPERSGAPLRRPPPIPFRRHCPHRSALFPCLRLPGNSDRSNAVSGAITTRWACRMVRSARRVVH